MREISTTYKFKRFSSQDEAAAAGRQDAHVFNPANSAKYWVDTNPPPPFTIDNVGDFAVYDLVVAYKGPDVLVDKNGKPYFTKLYVPYDQVSVLNIPPALPDPSITVKPEIQTPCVPLKTGEFLDWSNPTLPIRTVVINTESDLPDNGKFTNTDRKILLDNQASLAEIKAKLAALGVK